MNSLTPLLRFAPIYKDYLWGGDRIASRYGRVATPAPCAESWEISANPDGDGVVNAGPLAGRTLSSLASEFGRRLLGGRAPSDTRFPLLFKIIDARLPLSVQVHPSPADPAADPAEYKNECWHVLDAAPDTVIHAGIASGFASRNVLAALAERGADALAAALERHSPRPGETLSIPAGLVHAIGSGALIYEVQQNSNTTYRLHDWGRVGPDGKPRPLHLEAALRSIDFSLPPPRFMTPTPAQDGGAICLRTPFFTLREFRAAAIRRPAGASFEALFAKSGAWRVEAAGNSETLGAGDSLLVAAECPEYRVEPASPGAALLLTTL